MNKILLFISAFVLTTNTFAITVDFNKSRCDAFPEFDSTVCFQNKTNTKDIKDLEISIKLNGPPDAMYFNFIGIQPDKYTVISVPFKNSEFTEATVAVLYHENIIPECSVTISSTSKSGQIYSKGIYKVGNQYTCKNQL
jgi:hypothetical protein